MDLYWYVSDNVGSTPFASSTDYNYDGELDTDG